MFETHLNYRPYLFRTFKHKIGVFSHNVEEVVILMLYSQSFHFVPQQLRCCDFCNISSSLGRDSCIVTSPCVGGVEKLFRAKITQNLLFPSVPTDQIQYWPPLKNPPSKTVQLFQIIFIRTKEVKKT